MNVYIVEFCSFIRLDGDDDDDDIKIFSDMHHNGRQSFLFRSPSSVQFRLFHLLSISPARSLARTDYFHKHT